MNNNKNTNTSLEKEIKDSYLDYAMSVIVSRALPDSRDGLKPVHRRILYAMHKMKLGHKAKHRKSATIIGETLGKFHPHGDQAVYDSLTRMAQDFSLRYPLINGQGNFGSVDGDRAAAYRYTEAKLTPIAEEMLVDIEQNTVDFVPNYDDTINEPKVLPAKLPNLLINGSMGIAVGMATNMPSHNLGEVCDAVVHLIDNPGADTKEICGFIKGPDFATGGIIFGSKNIREAYSTGRGPVVIRSKTDIIKGEGDKFQIIVNELPYLVNKAKLLTKVADLVKNKKIEGVKDIRDESDKNGIRIVFELKKGTIPKKILNQLFKLTELQQTFHLNMVSLLGGTQPKIIGLKGLLDEYIKHRQDVVYRRAEYKLIKTKHRAHILKGLVIAIDHIDEVIKIIKKSSTKEQAKNNLVKKYKLSEEQANAILETRLHQLAGMEIKNIKNELKEKLKQIKKLEEILSKPKMILDIIKKETNELKEKYNDDRRTIIVEEEIENFKDEDLIPNDPTIIILTKSGYIKRLSTQSFRSQSRGGKGVKGLSVKDGDTVQQVIVTTTHAEILFFTNKGRVLQIRAYDVLGSTRTTRGQSLANFLEIQENEKISSILSTKGLKDHKNIIMATKNGTIKKVSTDAFKNIRKSGLIAIKLKKEDLLNWVSLIDDKDNVILVSSKGKSIYFEEKQLRQIGRTASGVRGIRLDKQDFIVGMGVVKASSKKENNRLLIITANGFGKATPIKSYRIQNRGGKGTKAAKINQKTGSIIGALIFEKNNLPDFIIGDVLVISEKGQTIRFQLKGVPRTGRVTQGVMLIKFKQEGDRAGSFALI